MVFASLAFIVVGGAVLGFLYWSMLFVIDGQISGALHREVSDMTAAYEKGGYERLRQTVADRASPHEDTVRIYLLIGPDSTLTGNLKEWPAHAPAARDCRGYRGAPCGEGGPCPHTSNSPMVAVFSWGARSPSAVISRPSPRNRS